MFVFLANTNNALEEKGKNEVLPGQCQLHFGSPVQEQGQNEILCFHKKCRIYWIEQSITLLTSVCAGVGKCHYTL